MSLSILVNVIIIKNECMREFSSIRLIFNQNFDVISNLSVYFVHSPLCLLVSNTLT